MLTRKEMKWMSGVLGIGILFIFLTMLYVDQLTNSNFGYRIMDSILRGQFKQMFNEMSWSYGLSIYFIYALWSIPVCIVGYIGGNGINMNAIPVLLWYKLLLVLFAFWSIFLVGKLAEQLYANQKREVQLQYMASFLFIFPVFAIAQCDIIGLCFVLLGVYYYMKEQNVSFIISFAVAITMKYFAVLIFLPLLLFRFRKIGKLILVLAAGLLPACISALVIHGSDTGAAARSNPEYYVNIHIQRLTEVRIDAGASRVIGLLGFFFTILCIIAYVLPNQDTEKNKKYAIWLAFFGYLCFFLFYNCGFYWYVLLVPFLILLVYTKPGLIKTCLLLESLFEVTVAFDCMNKQQHVFLGPDTFNYLFIKRDIINNWLFRNIYEFLQVYMPLILGVSYASIIAVLVLTFPREEQDVPLEDEMEKEIRIITWMKIGIIFLWIILALIGTINF